MKILSGGQVDFFGLDIGTTGIRVVQLKGSGPTKALDRYGQVVIEGTTALSEAKIDQQKVANAVRELIQQSGITTKNAAVNLPSNRVFTAVTDWGRLPADELAKTIRYQAESIIPTPLAQSKLDRSEEHTSELQSRVDLVCRLLLEKKKKKKYQNKMTQRKC